MLNFNFYSEDVLNFHKQMSYKKNKKLISDAIDNVINKTSSEMMGWLDLVQNYDKKLIEKIKKTAENINKNYDNFVVLGIGGSALGSKAVFEAFKYKKDLNKINCVVLDNIDPDVFIPEIESLDLCKTMFNVITKSGTTSETLSQMFIIIEKLKEKKLELGKHIIITTENDNSLYDFAVKNHIQTFIVPKNVGGRFSVFSCVGLLPICVMGADIVKMLKGAKDILENSKQKDENINDALHFALYNYLSYKKGKNQLVVMPYAQPLSLIPDYFAQLWSESLGKKLNKQNKIINFGMTPVKAIGVTDQHSQLQLYYEGPNDKTYLFIKVKNALFDKTVKTESLAKFAYLNNISLKQLLDVEGIATAYSLIRQNKPVIVLELDEINEECIGQLLFFFQMATAFEGELFNLNTYNQPGVEMVKVYTKALLKDEKYIKEKQEIECFFNNKY